MSNFKSMKGAGKSWTPTKNADGTPKYHGTDSIEGYYVDRKDGVGENNQSVYTLELEDGSKTDFWGTTSLNGQMDNVRQGSYIRVTWNGMKLTKMGATKFASVEACTNTKMRFHDYEVGVSQDIPALDMGHKVNSSSKPSSPSNATVAANENPFTKKDPNSTTQQPVNNTVAGASSFSGDASDLPF